MLHIRLRDILRATLPIRSGNQGWIGFSPKGDRYHVVVPVDAQIARGVMACNLPSDGTPFGGYAGWLYFRCPPFDEEGPDEKSVCRKKAAQTGSLLIQWLAAHGIEACLETDEDQPEQEPMQIHQNIACSGQEAPLPVRIDEAGPGVGTSLSGILGKNGVAPCSERWTWHSHSRTRGPLSCPGCSRLWRTLCAFVRDPENRFEAYRVCLDDFSRGRYIFSHACGQVVEVPVSRFARSIHRGKSLIGCHACPGLCYYEESLLNCSARCEGSGYRRIARKLKERGSKRAM